MLTGIVDILDTHFKAKLVVDTTKLAVQDGMAHAKETKDEKSSKIHAMILVKQPVDPAKEKKAKWQARKDEGRDDDRPHSKDETS
ncbi:hypothetical protein C0992_009953 [Termitomyces sp. T32_za158]|nr:hypothetical protein C0992_009953 [Termitomyces sp. T32_za158]